MSGKLPVLVLVAAALTSASAAPKSPPVAYRGARIYLGDGRMIDDGTIVVVGSRVETVSGAIRPPKGTRVVDMTGKVIVPGFIDAGSRRGTRDEMVEETFAITPHVEAVDAFDPFLAELGRVRRSGATTVVLMPTSGNLVSGLAFALSPGHPYWGSFARVRPCALKGSLTAAVFRHDRTPTSLPGGIRLLLERFAAARRYLDEKNGKKRPRHDAGLEALGLAVSRRIPFVVRADREGEIEAALHVFERAGVRGVIEGGTRAYRFAHRIARAKVGVILPLLSMSDPDWKLGAPGKLATAGVVVAFSSSAPDQDEANLLLSAVLAIKGGLGRELALATLTSNPARLLGIADRVGTLGRGKKANFCVFNGDPFSLSARMEKVFSQGVQIHPGGGRLMSSFRRGMRMGGPRIGSIKKRRAAR